LSNPRRGGSLLVLGDGGSGRTTLLRQVIGLTAARVAVPTASARRERRVRR